MKETLNKKMKFTKIKNANRKNKKTHLKLIGGAFSYEVPNKVTNIIVKFKSHIFIDIINNVLIDNTVDFAKIFKHIRTLLGVLIINIYTIIKELVKFTLGGAYIDKTTLEKFITQLETRDVKDKDWKANTKKYLRIILVIVLGLLLIYIPIDGNRNINLMSESQRGDIKLIFKKQLGEKTDIIKGKIIAEIYKIIIDNKTINDLASDPSINPELKSLYKPLVIPSECTDELCVKYIKTTKSVIFLLNLLFQNYMFIQEVKKKQIDLLIKYFPVKQNEELITKDTNFSKIISAVRNIKEEDLNNPDKLIKINEIFNTIGKTDPNYQPLILTKEEIEKQIKINESTSINHNLEKNVNTSNIIVNTTIYPILNTSSSNVSVIPTTSNLEVNTSSSNVSVIPTTSNLEVNTSSSNVSVIPTTSNLIVNTSSSNLAVNTTSSNLIVNASVPVIETASVPVIANASASVIANASVPVIANESLIPPTTLETQVPALATTITPEIPPIIIDPEPQPDITLTTTPEPAPEPTPSQITLQEPPPVVITDSPPVTTPEPTPALIPATGGKRNNKINKSKKLQKSNKNNNNKSRKYKSKKNKKTKKQKNKKTKKQKNKKTLNN